MANGDSESVFREMDRLYVKATQPSVSADSIIDAHIARFEFVEKWPAVLERVAAVTNERDVYRTFIEAATNLPIEQVSASVMGRAVAEGLQSDDNEPLTVEWLNERFKNWYGGRNRIGWELHTVCIVRELGDGGGFVPVFSHTGQGPSGAILRTRGDMRRLVKVLGGS